RHRYCTPTAALPSNMIFVATERVLTVRFPRLRIGRRYALEALARHPRSIADCASPKPLGSGPFRSSKIGYPAARAASRTAHPKGSLRHVYVMPTGPPAP